MDTDVTEVFVEIMRGAREAKGMTQVELGRLVGLDGTIITRIEKRQRGVSLDLALRLCEVLEIKLGDLQTPRRWSVVYAYQCARCAFLTRDPEEIADHSAVHDRGAA